MIAALVASTKLLLQSSVCNGFLQQKVEMSGFISTVCVGVKEATISDKTSPYVGDFNAFTSLYYQQNEKKTLYRPSSDLFHPRYTEKPSTHTVLHEQDAFFTFTPSSCTNLSLLYTSAWTV